MTVNWGDNTTWTFTTSNLGTLSAADAYATPGAFTAATTVTDKYGASGSASTPVTVTSPALSATFTNGGSVNEGNTAIVSFSNVTGGTGPYTYSYDFNNDGTFDVTGSTLGTATVPTQYLNPGNDTVRGRVTDSTGTFSDFTTTITVNNLSPLVTAGRSGQTGSKGVSATVSLAHLRTPA